MKKTFIVALERVFAAEIEGRLPFQSKAKIYKELEEFDLVAPMERLVGAGTLKVRVSGWQLTHAGRYAYCMTCDDKSESMINDTKSAAG